MPKRKTKATSKVHTFDAMPGHAIYERRVTSKRNDNSGRIEKDVFEPSTVLSPCVKTTLLKTSQEECVRLAFTLHHDPPSDYNERRKMEKRFRVLRSRCVRYGHATSDQVDAYRKPFKPKP